MDGGLLEDLRSVTPASPARADRLTALACAGEINVANLAEPYSAVCSGLTGLLISGLITFFVSLASEPLPQPPILFRAC